MPRMLDAENNAKLPKFISALGNRSICNLELAPAVDRLQDLAQPPYVYARVSRQLWVEADTKDIALAHSDDVVGASVFVSFIMMLRLGRGGQRGHDLDGCFQNCFCKLVCRGLGWCDDGSLARFLLYLNTVTVGEDLLNNGSADEDASIRLIGGLVNRVAKKGKLESRLEAFDLATKVVPVDSYVKSPNEVLAAFFGSVCRLRQQDESGACPPRGFAEHSTHSQSVSRFAIRAERTSYLTKSLNGSSMAERAATSEMVVLSPPGRMSPSQRASCSGVLTSMKSHFVRAFGAFACAGAFLSASAAARRSCTCSLNAPCSASTPTVTSGSATVISQGQRFATGEQPQSIRQCSYRTAAAVLERPWVGWGRPAKKVRVARSPKAVDRGAVMLMTERGKAECVYIKFAGPLSIIPSDALPHQRFHTSTATATATDIVKRQTSASTTG